MTSAAFVATLIAPRGASLSGDQIASVTASITQSGGRVEKTVSLDNRAADIFFVDQEESRLPQSRWYSPPLAGGARGGVGGQDNNGASSFPFDLLIQPAATRRKKLLIADMESTIIEQEMLDELAAELGIREQVAAITRRAMNGEIDLAEALSERAALFKGQPASLLDKAAARMTLMPGAQELIAALKKSGTHCWLVSGGIQYFVKIIAERLGFDRYFGNKLLVSEGVITGEMGAPILDKNAKKTLLEKACAEYGCRLAEAVTVGDGANDIPMLQACGAGGGLGVAYHAKPKVREVIHNRIDHGDLSALIYAMGLK